MNVLITGGAGFIGHHVVEHFLKNTDWELTVLDALGYSSNGWDRLRDIKAFDDHRVVCIAHDLQNPIEDGLAAEVGRPDVIVHIAAESHVDRSITNPHLFARSNVIGTLNTLDFARWQEARVIYFSTDEVYGPAPGDTRYKEGDRFLPGNPYAASKAAAECFCYAYANTYQMPITITNTMNVFGERQHAEKFIPMCIRKILAGETVTIHSAPDKTTPGSRFYIHARNVASALLHIIRGLPMPLENEDASYGKWNIVGSKEWDNLSLARMIATMLGKDLKYEMVDFHGSRPGHDLRYALDGTKMAQYGWKPAVSARESLERTVQWTLEHPEWLGPENGINNIASFPKRK